MMVAGALRAATRDQPTTPTVLDCSASPTNASSTATGESSSTVSNPAVPSLTPADLANMFAVHSAAMLKQNLLKQQELPSFGLPGAPTWDPSALFALTSLLGGMNGAQAAPSLAPSVHTVAPVTPAPQSVAPSSTTSTSNASSVPAGGGRMNSSNGGNSERKRPYPCSFQYCVLCQKDVHSSKLPCHIRQCHVAKPMFQCPACDFTSTYSKNNVKSHMVSLHGLAGDPISYMDQYASQVEEFMKVCFPNVRGRGRPNHGRTSPHSPSSPSVVTVPAVRRNSQATVNRRPSVSAEQQQIMQAAAAMQQRQVAEQAAAQWLNPFIFPNSLLAAALPPPQALPKATPVLNNNLMDYGMLLGLRPPAVKQQDARESTKSAEGGSGESTASVAASSTTNEEAAPSNSVSSATHSLLSPSFSPRVHRSLFCRYISVPTLLHGLSEADCTGTVFRSLPSSPTHIVEKLDLTQFEEMQSTAASLFTEEQLSKVSELRAMAEFDTFTTLYKLHRMDTTIPAEIVEQLASLAPSEVDAKRILLHAEQHGDDLNDEETMLVELARIPRLQEKLTVLQHMNNFKGEVDDMLRTLCSVCSAVCVLRSSADFAQIIQMVLTLGNLLNGDAHSELFQGYRVSRMDEMINYNLPSGKSFLSLLCTVIRRNLPEFAVSFDVAAEQLLPLTQVDFPVLLLRSHHLQEGTLRAERELRASDAACDFAARAHQPLMYLQEQLTSTMDQLISLLDFLGEPRNAPSEPFQPATVFRRMLAFVRAVQPRLAETEEEVDVEKDDEVDDEGVVKEHLQ